MSGRFLSDREGKPSSMRLMALLSLLTAIGLALLPTITMQEIPAQETLVLYFLTAAFAPKAVQKFAEKG